jgi:DNA-binding response OmpR family regulator
MMMTPVKSPPLRVLVIDDCRDTCASLGMLLQHWGYDPLTATTGTEAAALEDERPDAIILDIRLPDMDGVDVLRRVRQRWGHRRPFVLCVSGWADDATRRSVREAGGDAFLVKPANPADIERLLRGHLGPCHN